ncbi:MAG: carbohydrate-binding protein, partial [Lachnospiraceae bacterium]|nr:carbohydrate-binding protein [Lachnospiraceae bacterium]
PVVNITSGTTVGYRYLQFGSNSAGTVTVALEEAKKVKVNVRIDSYKGRVIGSLDFDGSVKEETAKLETGVIGKHAVYFEFLSEDENEAYIFDRFTFDR